MTGPHWHFLAANRARPKDAQQSRPLHLYQGTIPAPSARRYSHSTVTRAREIQIYICETTDVDCLGDTRTLRAAVFSFFAICLAALAAAPASADNIQGQVLGGGAPIAKSTV